MHASCHRIKHHPCDLISTTSTELTQSATRCNLLWTGLLGYMPLLTARSLILSKCKKEKTKKTQRVIFGPPMSRFGWITKRPLLHKVKSSTLKPRSRQLWKQWLFLCRQSTNKCSPSGPSPPQLTAIKRRPAGPDLQWGNGATGPQLWGASTQRGSRREGGIEEQGWGSKSMHFVENMQIRTNTWEK